MPDWNEAIRGGIHSVLNEWDGWPRPTSGGAVALFGEAAGTHL